MEIFHIFDIGVLMRKFVALGILFLTLVAASPGHCFFDYLFGGAASRDAIDNSTVGDLRAWWTGNPAYQFNPYYSGSNPQQGQQQGGQQMQAPPVQQPYINYVPPQANQPNAYGNAQQPPAAYGAQPSPYDAAPQQYQQPVAQPPSAQLYQTPGQGAYQQQPMQQYGAQAYPAPAQEGYQQQQYAPQANPGYQQQQYQ